VARIVEDLRKAAIGSVSRACGFGALAIACTMIGFAHDLVHALQAGGILLLLMALVLMWKAHVAPTTPYKRTEAWLMLDPAKRPPASVAQWAFGTVLRDVYLRFARVTAILAGALLALALVIAAARALT
jgi:hypothetical protein